jgi:phosphoadenosine phosphosulfate reductase
MALIDQTLFGIRDKVAIAIERLKNFEPVEGYYLAFSGGKDSVTLYRLAEMAGVKFDAHYNATTIDPPELVRFIKASFPTVERHKPEENMWRLISNHQSPPFRQMRHCCTELKERGGHGRLVLTGIRWAESPRRAKRQMTELCYNDGTKTFLHPIIDWSNAEVWEFIHKYEVPYCSLYDEGFKRLGCVLCPMSSQQQRDIDRWPQIAAKYVQTLQSIVEERKTKIMGYLDGKPVIRPISFATGQEWFDWWIQRNKRARNESQPVLFE